MNILYIRRGFFSFFFLIKGQQVVGVVYSVEAGEKQLCLNLLVVVKGLHVHPSL